MSLCRRDRRRRRRPGNPRNGSRFAFVSGRSGEEEIWISPREGGEPSQLTTLRAANTGTPRWSPDSRCIAFDSSVSGKPEIYVIDSHGGAPRLLTAEAFGGFEPSWRPDGRWIYFTSTRSGRTEIWKTLVARGAPERITKTGAYEALAAPDGKLIYFTKPVPGAGFRIWCIPAGGGPETPVAELQRFDQITRS
jgi:Tol biopolymer transport system component